jgi:SAM-dependent methyltransferase
MFAWSAQMALVDYGPGTSQARAMEAVPPGGVVLDVGAGGGAASLPLVPPAGMLVAIDESQAMLDAFAAGAGRLGVAHTEVAGRWPDVADQVPEAAVVVCRHVVYNVADLAPFLAALHGHAQRRVVVELTELHPQSDLGPLWKAIHGLDRPSTPTAQDAIDVASALGYDVHVERSHEPSLWHEWPRQERLAFARRRLCLGPDHDAEIGAYLDRTANIPRELVTLWWDRAPSGRGT